MKDKILNRIREKWQVEFEPLAIDNRIYDILSIGNMSAHIDKLVATHAIREPLKDLPLWAKVWPASMVLGRFLRKFEPEGKTLLELGCGMGILSMIAAQYPFASITASDICEEALDFARVNILQNQLNDRVTIRRLDVSTKGEDGEMYDIIAASELLYLDDLHRPLLKFLGRHLQGQAFFCTDIARHKPRFARLAAKNFHVREGCVGVKSSGADGEERRVYNITILEKK